MIQDRNTVLEITSPKLPQEQDLRCDFFYLYY